MEIKKTVKAEKRKVILNIQYRKGTMDEFIIKEVFDMDEYAFDELNLSKQAIVIDIGAQIGCFTLKSAVIANKGRVFSFEPMKSNFEILERNIKLNNLKNVLFFQKGVSKDKGKRRLFLSLDNTGGHSISTKRSERYETIDCVSLKEVILNNNLKYIELIKFDCEGAEYEIIYSLPNLIFLKIKKMVIEFHDFENTSNNFDKLYIFLRKKGFVLQRFKRYSKIHGMAYFIRF